MNEAVATEHEPVTIDATTGKKEAVEMKEVKGTGGTSNDVPHTNEDDLLNAACNLLGNATDPCDPSFVAVRDATEQLALNPSLRVSEAVRIATMNVIANARSLAEAKQQQQSAQLQNQQQEPVQQAAQPQEQPLAEPVTPASKQIHGPATAAEVRREQEQFQQSHHGSLAV